jgi:hypothetical protein
MLWAQALDLRTEWTHVTETHPSLAERLQGIAAILDTPANDVVRARNSRWRHTEHHAPRLIWWCTSVSAAGAAARIFLLPRGATAAVRRKNVNL